MRTEYRRISLLFFQDATLSPIVATEAIIEDFPRSGNDVSASVRDSRARVVSYKYTGEIWGDFVHFEDDLGREKCLFVRLFASAEAASSRCELDAFNSRKTKHRPTMLVDSAAS